MTHTPRKRFGQNFLHDHNIIYNILSSLQAKPDQHWVEIGPGLGALTEPLLKMGMQLDVVELDRDLVALLKEKFKERDLNIHSEHLWINLLLLYIPFCFLWLIGWIGAEAPVD